MTPTPDNTGRAYFKMMNYQELNATNIKGLYKETLYFENKPSVGDLARRMQQVTEHAMEDLGADIRILNENHLIWVLCFSQIEIFRMPQAGEKTVMFSWPGENRLGMCPRRYVLFSENGEVLFACTSLSSPVNAQTRTMVLPEQAGITFPVITIPEEPKNPKIKEKGPAPDREYLHTALESEIDMNDHVNNAFYLDWIEPAVDAFTENGKHSVKSIWISYVKEILCGETVRICYGQDTDVLFIKGYVGEVNCFIVKVTK